MEIERFALWVAIMVSNVPSLAWGWLSNILRGRGAEDGLGGREIFLASLPPPPYTATPARSVPVIARSWRSDARMEDYKQSKCLALKSAVYILFRFGKSEQRISRFLLFIKRRSAWLVSPYNIFFWLFDFETFTNLLSKEIASPLTCAQLLLSCFCIC